MSGVAVTLERDGAILRREVTDGDGRVKELAARLSAGRYRLSFELSGFFRRVALDVELGDDAHYHVPILISPFGFTTYRGS